jgi:hypothetical protein
VAEWQWFWLLASKDFDSNTRQNAREVGAFGISAFRDLQLSDGVSVPASPIPQSSLCQKCVFFSIFSSLTAPMPRVLEILNLFRLSWGRECFGLGFGYLFYELNSAPLSLFRPLILLPVDPSYATTRLY